VPEKHIRRRLVLAGFAVILIVFVWMMLRRAPISVQTAKSARGPMRLTVDEDGETRAHDRFVVAAPIPGRLLRVGLEEGALVREGQVVAQIQPLPLNQQQREVVLARVETAEAAKRQADARVLHAREVHEQAKRELQRAEQLGRADLIPKQGLEQARSAEVTSAQELAAAQFSAEAAIAEVKVARAGMVGIEEGSAGQKLVSLRAPIAGSILRVVEKSERVVQAGAPIVVLGDPRRIEIVTDVLTTDAVNIRPGALVILNGWGGDHPLRAKVRLVEPSGFTKISALGVEEKRVNVIADFTDPPDGLGDGFRVDASIVTWEGSDVLKIPTSAVFREREGWSVFVVENGRAHRRPVQIGHRNQSEAEILGGLAPAEEVILHPSNQLSEGVRVKEE
jgi:HlyD family secretion protein